MSTDGSTEKMSFYVEEPPINTELETFFTTYASIPATALRDRLLDVRKRAWERHNYPCLGRWGFLDFSIQQSPIYKEILDKCKNEGATVIDFGCCLGQDIRKLAYDGVSLDQLRGYELDSFFVELGYELFQDGKIMQEKKVFTCGDIFDDQLLNSIEPADYVYVGAFIHLFDANTQKEVCQRLTRLAKRAIAGRQVGSETPGEHARVSGPPNSKMMRHSPESFAQMWDEATNHQWQVETATLEMACDTNRIRPRLIFVVRKRSEN